MKELFICATPNEEYRGIYVDFITDDPAEVLAWINRNDSVYSVEIHYPLRALTENETVYNFTLWVSSDEHGWETKQDDEPLPAAECFFWTTYYNKFAFFHVVVIATNEEGALLRAQQFYERWQEVYETPRKNKQ